jgi:L-alanine-DL-glutamate epimerase-like enolase superfamily enzyme
MHGSLAYRYCRKFTPPITVRTQNNEMSKNAQTRNHSGIGCRRCHRTRLFLEDPLSPEDIEYFREIRQQSATPIAMGGLFTSPQEWMPVITGRLIGHLRIHVPQAGSVTPCRKVAILAEPFGVRAAWHGPGDLSRVGHCANVLSLTNFGIQEGANSAQQSRKCLRVARCTRTDTYTRTKHPAGEWKLMKLPP